MKNAGEADYSDKKAADVTENRSSLPTTGAAHAIVSGESTVPRRVSHDVSIGWTSAASLDVFDDFDWELDPSTQSDVKAMTEEYLKKRQTVLEEKVRKWILLMTCRNKKTGAVFS